MRYWLLKIIEVLDTINSGLNPEEPTNNLLGATRTTKKKNGGKMK